MSWGGRNHYAASSILLGPESLERPLRRLSCPAAANVTDFNADWMQVSASPEWPRFADVANVLL